MLDDFKIWMEIGITAMMGPGDSDYVYPEFQPLTRNGAFPHTTPNKRFNNTGLSQNAPSLSFKRNLKPISQTSTNRMASRDPMRNVPR